MHRHQFGITARHLSQASQPGIAAMHRSQASKQSTIRNGVLLSSDSRPAHCGIDTVNWIWLLKRFLTLFNETVLAIVRTLCTIVWFVSDCAARFHSGTRSLRFNLLLLALLLLLSSSTLIAAHSWALVHCAIHAELCLVSPPHCAGHTSLSRFCCSSSLSY